MVIGNGKERKGKPFYLGNFKSGKDKPQNARAAPCVPTLLLFPSSSPDFNFKLFGKYSSSL